MAKDKFQEHAAQAVESIDRLISFRMEEYARRQQGLGPSNRAVEIYAMHKDNISKCFQLMQMQPLYEAMERMM